MQYQPGCARCPKACIGCLVIVADRLGHETLDTVRLYTAPDDEARALALDALITDQ